MGRVKESRRQLSLHTQGWDTNLQWKPFSSFSTFMRLVHLKLFSASQSWESGERTEPIVTWRPLVIFISSCLWSSPVSTGHMIFRDAHTSSRGHTSSLHVVCGLLHVDTPVLVYQETIIFISPMWSLDVVCKVCRVTESIYAIYLFMVSDYLMFSFWYLKLGF